MKRYKLLIVAVGLLVMLAAVGFAADGKKSPPVKTETTEIDQQLEAAKAAIAERTGEQIKWQVIAAGGTEGTSDNYQMRGTAGQTAVGTATSESYGLSHGYWQQTSSGGCCIPPIRGNVDYDGGDAIDISDLVYLVDYMFSGGPAPECLEEADMNADLAIDISDLVWLVDYMFTGGPAPLGC